MKLCVCSNLKIMKFVFSLTYINSDTTLEALVICFTEKEILGSKRRNRCFRLCKWASKNELSKISWTLFNRKNSSFQIFWKTLNTCEGTTSFLKKATKSIAMAGLDKLRARYFRVHEIMHVNQSKHRYVLPRCYLRPWVILLS